VLLITLFGVGAILLAQRIGDSDMTAPGAPQGDQPAALGAQAETPTIIPPTSTPVPVTVPAGGQMSSGEITATALVNEYHETQSALTEGLQPLPPTVVPPTGT